MPEHRIGMSAWIPIAVEGVISALSIRPDAPPAPPASSRRASSTGTAPRSRNGNEFPDILKMASLMARYLIDDYGMHYYARAQNVVRPVARGVRPTRFAGVDLLVLPTSPTKAHPLPDPNASREELLAPGFAPITNTAPFNATGHPAMSVPVGLSDGLPVGMMIVGAHAAEVPDLPARARHRAAVGLADGVTLDDPGPLAGVRVLELDSPLTAYAGRLLWELGADVVLVEPSTGSPTRGTRRGCRLRPLPRRQASARARPRAADQARLAELLDGADVVIEGTTPDSLRLPADADPVDATTWSMSSLTPFGTTGPRAGVARVGPGGERARRHGGPDRVAGRTSAAAHRPTRRGTSRRSTARSARCWRWRRERRRATVSASRSPPSNASPPASKPGAIPTSTPTRSLAARGSTHPIAPHRLFRSR